MARVGVCTGVESGRVLGESGLLVAKAAIWRAPGSREPGSWVPNLDLQLVSYSQA